MNISIFGLGYVGCVGMGCLAQNGHKVIGVDITEAKVNAINRGESPIIEKGINELLRQQFDLGHIEATNDPIYAVTNSDVSFICAGTPSTPEGHLNLKAIFKVSEDISLGLKEKNAFHVIVIRSTVLPGTNEKVSAKVAEITGKKPGLEFAVVSNPEFLREGSAINDYFHPPYTLIGTTSEKASEIMKAIYEKIESPLIISDILVAEIMKYVCNAFHAQKVVFANEVGNICKKLGINSHRVMEIFCLDKKLNISPYYFKPGFAYGGSCLPKDLKALQTIAHDNYLNCHLIDSIARSNEHQIELAYNQIMSLQVSNLGFLGLSFKADTDDLRNSPILDIIERLLGKGYGVKIFDKNVHFSQLMGANKEYILRKIPFISKFVTDDSREIVKDSEAIIIVNNSVEFKEILESLPEDKIIYDLVNYKFDRREMRKNYIGVAW